MNDVVHPDFAAVERTLRSVCVPRSRGGMAASVIHRGERVVDLALGTRDEAGAPFTTDTLCLAMSTSKAVTATLLHALVSDGVIDLDKPVAHYWPAFAANGKGGITVSQVVSHQAGLYAITDLIGDARHIDKLTDWDAMLAAVAAAKPRHRPGRNFAYHAWTMGWILGGVMEHATGKRFPELLHERLAAPLGLGGLYIGVPEHELGRVAHVFVPQIAKAPMPRWLGYGALRAVDLAFGGLGMNSRPTEAWDAMWPPGLAQIDMNSAAFRTASIPSVNGIYDARSLCDLFAAMLPNAGEAVMSSNTLTRATRDQNGVAGLVVPFPLRLKMGYMRPISVGFPTYFGGTRRDVGVASPNAFGHFGFGGSGAWADPDRDLSVGVVTNCFAGKLPIDIRTAALCTVVAGCADRRS